MKGLPIKFRGLSMGGNYVYGLPTKKKARNSGKLSYAIADGNFTQDETFTVFEGSIAQLVGYDKDGAEIYEDDILITDTGDEERAAIWTIDFSHMRLK